MVGPRLRGSIRCGDAEDAMRRRVGEEDPTLHVGEGHPLRQTIEDGVKIEILGLHANRSGMGGLGEAF
jgi:hypothetical protein